MLADERFDDGESLTRTRSADYPGAAERVHNVHPAFAELTLIVVAHGNIDAILVIHFIRHLLEALILVVEAVFKKSVLQVFGDIVKSHMAKHGAQNRHHEIQPDAAV